MKYYLYLTVSMYYPLELYADKLKMKYDISALLAAEFLLSSVRCFFFFFQAEDGIRDAA
ncbi:hypothetical protein JSCD12_36420 [Clostridioides difficile]|nr:hypothetical protein JSCD12_36420 [Clostridioides difficile]